MGEALLMNRSQEWKPEYTYTNGTCTYTDEGNGNWNIKFLTSGTGGGKLTFIQPNSARRGIDVFLVGGGGGMAMQGGWVHESGQYGPRAGGGGGYTTTVSGISITRRTEYTIIVGAGGKANATSEDSGRGNRGADGGESSATFSSACKAAGGKGGWAWQDGEDDNKLQCGNGGSGGSGGSGYNYGTIGDQYSQHPGGTDGEDGSVIGTSSTNNRKGTGQHRTTGEFGNSSATKYSKGGGYGTTATNNTGNGGWSNQCTTSNIASYPAANGASGIVIIRNRRG